MPEVIEGVALGGQSETVDWHYPDVKRSLVLSERMSLELQQRKNWN
jgi:hypothetical protein